MAVHLSWPKLPSAFRRKHIVLDTRDILLEFVNKVFSRENVAEEMDSLERYLQHVFDDVQLMGDAEYELTYRCYEISEVGEGTLSEAYENLGRAIYRALKEAQVYEGDLLVFSFQRLLTHDIVLVRTDMRE